MPDHSMEYVLSFDYGRRFIGVAIGNCLTKMARPLTTLQNKGQTINWPSIDELFTTWKPAAYIVGLPLDLEGREQPASQAARQFAHDLTQRYSRPVHLVDERYTSQEASARFAEQRAQGNARRKNAQLLDAIAAQIILEAWFATVNSPDN